MDSPAQEFLSRLRNVARSGDGWAADCPAHEDTGRHLTVTEAEDGRVLAHCQHSGCSFLRIMQSVGLEAKDAFPKPVRNGDAWEFHVRDASANKTAVHGRRDKPGGKKDVWWRGPDGSKGSPLKSASLPLWGSEAIGSVPPDEFIVITEGEKAAYYLTRNGIPALGTVTGASGTPGEEALAPLEGLKVILWPDNDAEGKAHMLRIADALLKVAGEVRVYEWPEAPEKGDAADHPAVKLRDPEGLAALKEELSAAPLRKIPREQAGASSFEYLREEFVKWVEAKDGDITGIRTGLTKVDERILGLSPGRSYVIAAPPGVGKSLLCGQIGLVAARRGSRVLLHSIESSAMEYLQRMTCYMAGVDYFRAIRRKTGSEERERLKSQFELLAAMPFMVTDLGTQKPSFIRGEVERHQPDLVIIDYLQYATPDQPTGNAVQDLDLLSRQLSSIKGDYNVPVVMAAQINRDSRNQNAEPELHNLRGSGALEQDADVVMFLHRKDEDGEPAETTRLLCKKNRIAKRFNVDLRFAPGQQWFIQEDDVRRGVIGHV